MPTWKRRHIEYTAPSESLQDAARTDGQQPIFVLNRTGELFEDYDSYSARLSFYNRKEFSCELTGKAGLDFWQALKSEQEESKNIKERFPECLKAEVLRSVQWQIIGRVDTLVDMVFDRFKNRYFCNEQILVEVQGDKFLARILEVYPPKHRQTSDPHRVGCNMSLSLNDSIDRDDPKEYKYKVQLIEEGSLRASRVQATLPSHPSVNGEKASGPSTKWSGSVMDVDSSAMSRDRTAFSKSILRRLLRECVDRQSAVASPWTIKSSIASRYGLGTVMPEETKKEIETVRKCEIDKRKKVWEDKEGPPTKKQKKNAEKEERALQKQEDDRLRAEEKEAALVEAKKKKLKYPAEDLDVHPSDRERKHRLKTRPAPKRDVPFGEDFESFLTGWSYLQVFGSPLNLSPFTLDELEYAIAHSGDSSCFLISEIHSCLAYNIRQVTGNRNTASASLQELQQDVLRAGAEDCGDVSIENLLSVLSERGNNWERLPLRATITRDGWVDSVIGILKDHATIHEFPRLREVLTSILFPPYKEADGSNATVPSFVAYNRMPNEDKLALLSFLCDCSVSSKSVRAYMETCDEQLTFLRKEKTEVNREKKKLVEQIDELTGNSDKKKQFDADGDAKEEFQDPPLANGLAEGQSDEEADKRSASDDISSETASQSRMTTPVPNVSTIKAVRLKVHGHALQRKLDREKAAREKESLAEQRRLEDEVNRLNRRLDTLDLEFRKLFGAARGRPMGKDRFFTRVWWLDGLGGSSLLSQAGTCVYGAGRVFIQGPTELDWEYLEQREAEEADVMVRMREDLGDDGVMDIGEWGYFDDPETGKRELQLRNALSPWKAHICNGMRKRNSDISLKNGESRRSSRQATVETNPEQTYLTWSNLRAPVAPGISL